MRLKPVPDAPADLAFVDEARRAVPLVPGTEEDCCARLVRRLDLPSRDVARTWLTFLRALELVAETDAGFRRTDVDPDPDRLRRAFRERVYLADDVLDALADADAPLTAAETFERVRDRVPEWERSRRRDWESFWLERVVRLLDWAVLLGLAVRAPPGDADETGDVSDEGDADEIGDASDEGDPDGTDGADGERDAVDDRAVAASDRFTLAADDSVADP